MMRATFIEILQFIKHPVLEKDPNTDLGYRIKKFIEVLLICYISTFFLGPLMVIIENLGFVDLEKHSLDTMFENKSKLTILFLAVVLAPVIEELIFRAPLTLFKKRHAFSIAFYLSALIFGFIHISNYEITTNILLFSPILVAPQLVLGFYLGFIRVRFGLLYSILLHACFNGLITFFIFSSENTI